MKKQHPVPKNGTKRRRGRPRKNPENAVKSDNNLNSQPNSAGTKMVPVPQDGTSDEIVEPVPKVPSKEETE